MLCTHWETNLGQPVTISVLKLKIISHDQRLITLITLLMWSPWSHCSCAISLAEAKRSFAKGFLRGTVGWYWRNQPQWHLVAGMRSMRNNCTILLAMWWYTFTIYENHNIPESSTTVTSFFFLRLGVFLWDAGNGSSPPESNTKTITLFHVDYYNYCTMHMQAKLHIIIIVWQCKSEKMY